MSFLNSFLSDEEIKKLKERQEKAMNPPMIKKYAIGIFTLSCYETKVKIVKAENELEALKTIALEFVENEKIEDAEELSHFMTELEACKTVSDYQNYMAGWEITVSKPVEV